MISDDDDGVDDGDHDDDNINNNNGNFKIAYGPAPPKSAELTNIKQMPL